MGCWLRHLLSGHPPPSITGPWQINLSVLCSPPCAGPICLKNKKNKEKVTEIYLFTFTLASHSVDAALHTE